jgi:hypothetical protein
MEHGNGRYTEERLRSREAQTRSWVAPVPDVTALPRVGEEQKRSWAAPVPNFTTLPQVGEAPRIRLEWDTRETVNNRYWAATVDAGAKEVTTSMLAGHPTAGASPMMPSAARVDERHYGEGPRWMSEGGHPAVAAPPDPRVSGWKPRPVGAPGSLFQNAWLEGFDIEGRDTTRELRGVVREDMSGRSEDAAARIMGRTFENQWMTDSTRETIIRAQMDAAARLRPERDDWTRSFSDDRRSFGNRP